MHNQKRYDWLLKNFREQDGGGQNAIRNLYIARGGRGIEDSDLLYEVMFELNVKLSGDDPDPPKIIPTTAAGALEYEDAMAAMELLSE